MCILLLKNIKFQKNLIIDVKYLFLNNTVHTAKNIFYMILYNYQHLTAFVKDNNCFYH